MDAITKHKRRILTAIKVEAAKKETHVPKPPKRVWKHSYARKRFRFDTYNVGELCAK